MPFSRWKNRAFLLRAKKGKENKTKKTKQTKNKEGFGPSEVALWATSPDPWTLKKQQQQQQQQKTKPNKKKQNKKN